MSKEGFLIASFAGISLLSTLLLFVLYIIFFKTPKEMKMYRWFLVNNQISAYLSSIYWTTLMTPIPGVYPIPHLCFIGLWNRVFGTSVKTVFAIESFLHCLMTAAFLICISFRYKQLCYFEEHWIYRKLLKNSQMVELFGYYFLSPLTLTYVTYIGLLSDEETRAVILKLDPDQVFPSVVTSFSDQAHWWALSLLFVSLAGIFVGTFLVYDCNRILKTIAQSNRTAALHKEAIVALIIQMSLMEGVSMITGSIMGTLHFMSLGNQMFNKDGLLDTFLSVAACFHGMKSICSSCAVILVHKPYRAAVRDIFWKQETQVILVSSANPSTDPAS